MAEQNIEPTSTSESPQVEDSADLKVEKVSEPAEPILSKDSESVEDLNAEIELEDDEEDEEEENDDMEEDFEPLEGESLFPPGEKIGKEGNVR